jgi:hypothetical protein
MAIAVLVMASPAWSEDVPAKIPAAHGTTLSGTAVVLPDALKGKVGVLVVGFSHASQGQVMNWGRLITADYGRSPGLDYYEIPMLGGAPKMLRGMIIKSMGKSVPADQRPHFMPLVEDDKPWRTVAKYWKPDDAYLLLVDGDGVVRWQIEGDATDAAYARLKEQLDGMLTTVGSH